MKISACIIAKNEEENLPILLESIKGKFDEIVLVDTGSIDKTVEIAKNYGCKVYTRKWNGFADARNYAVEKAKGKWIWFFDADMELEEKEYERFRRIVNLIDKDESINGIRVIYKNISPSGKIISLSSTVHIHRKTPELIWVGKIHERLVNKKGDVVTPPYPVYVNHYGYSDPKVMKEKIKRNLSLLEEELKGIDKEKDTEEYLIKLFYLAQTYSASSSLSKENTDKVIKYALEFLSTLRDKDGYTSIFPFYRHIYVYLLNSLINKKEYEKAEKYLKEAFRLEENYPDFYYIDAVLKEKKGDKEKSLNSYIRFVILVDKSYISKTEDINIISDYSHNILYIVDKKLPEMISDIEKLKKKWKKEKGIYLGILLSNVYIKNNMKNEALKVLDKLYKMHNDPMVGNRYASLLKSTDIDKALKILTKVKDTNPTYFETYYNLAKLYDEKGEYDKALEYIISYTKRVKDEKGLSFLYKLLKINGFLDEAQKLEKSFTRN